MLSSRSGTIEVQISDERAYGIRFAALEDLPRLLGEAGLPTGNALLVTDEHVAQHYMSHLEDSMSRERWRLRANILTPGEPAKSRASLDRLYHWALSAPIDRGTPVIALGGGVVGDLAGFMAATLLRGLPLVHLPTSLIALVDSSIGGKTGINHPSGKNLIGAFHQPRFVLADASTLRTLPEREYASGLAEVAKSALVADSGFFAWLETNWTAILERDDAAIGEMVFRSAEIKAEIVSEDPLDFGRRRLLNFGHTFGHAVELATDFASFTHGEAVALGMRAALHLSGSVLLGRAQSPGTISPPFQQADSLLARIPIAASLAEIDVASLVRAMTADKKRADRDLRFVVLRALGEGMIVETADPIAVEMAWHHAISVTQD